MAADHTQQYNPPPPSPENDTRQQAKRDDPGGAIAVPLDVLKPIAQWYTQLRPFAPIIMRVARIKQKIPAELDDAMYALAGGNPEEIKHLVEQRKALEGQTMELAQQVQGGSYEVPQDTPGAQVMTEDMAAEAYFLNLPRSEGGKGLGTQQIAEWFTSRGSPVSKSTVIRYVDDYKHQLEDEEDERQSARSRLRLIGVVVVSAWVGSVVGLHLLLNFLHIL